MPIVDDLTGILPPERYKKSDGCWTFIGYCLPAGYGIYKKTTAHRYVLEKLTGPLGDLDACHHCDNPTCVRPSHLFRGTEYDNAIDKVMKGRHRGGKKGTSGIVGIVWRSREQKWSVTRYRDGQSITYGSFIDLEEAIEANKKIPPSRQRVHIPRATGAAGWWKHQKVKNFTKGE